MIVVTANFRRTVHVSHSLGDLDALMECGGTLGQLFPTFGLDPGGSIWYRSRRGGRVGHWVVGCGRRGGGGGGGCGRRRWEQGSEEKEDGDVASGAVVLASDRMDGGAGWLVDRTSV